MLEISPLMRLGWLSAVVLLGLVLGLLTCWFSAVVSVVIRILWGETEGLVLGLLGLVMLGFSPLLRLGWLSTVVLLGLVLGLLTCWFSAVVSVVIRILWGETEGLVLGLVGLVLGLVGLVLGLLGLVMLGFSPLLRLGWLSTVVLLGLVLGLLTCWFSAVVSVVIRILWGETEGLVVGLVGLVVGLLGLVMLGLLGLVLRFVPGLDWLLVVVSGVGFVLRGGVAGFTMVLGVGGIFVFMLMVCDSSVLSLCCFRCFRKNLKKCKRNPLNVVRG